MASEVYINIKDLPELSEIGNGDYIIVETSTGTHTINFENFLIPTQNTVLTTVVEQNATTLTTVASSLTNNINSVKAELSSIFINTKQVQISTGTNTVSEILFSGRTDISPQNIIISPYNRYAAECPAYVDSINTGTGMVTIRSLCASLTNNAIYNILVVKS